MTDALLRVEGVTKRFPGVVALSGVDLELRSGEVLALIGENGAGKSTLMKILAGVQSPDEGRLLLEGEPVSVDSVRRATELGIALIHQELNLCDNLSVAENLFLGREPSRLGFVDRARMRSEAARWLARVGLEVDPGRLVSSLSVGQQQLLEIAKALSTDARIVIMDEPTSSLSQAEAQRLFGVVEQLRSEGHCVVYISHRLSEVLELADRIVVLRDGERVGELDREQASHDAMVRMMVGRDVEEFYVRRPHPIGETVLRVEGLETQRFPGRRIDLELRRGEIVGLAGLVGAGRSELLRAIFGADQALGGRVTIGEQVLPLGDVGRTAARGIAFVPEERKADGLLLEAGVSENLSIASLDALQRFGFLQLGKERDRNRELVDELGIKTPSLEQPVRFLSGGNQQKVVLGKWLVREPRVLLLDEPTRGIDIGAKQEIYARMEALAEAGMGILFVSSDMAEVLGMADRVVVMHEGRISGELLRDELSEEAVMSLMAGLEADVA